MVYQIPAEPITMAVPGALSRIRAVNGFGIRNRLGSLVAATARRRSKLCRARGGVKKGSIGRLSNLNPWGEIVPSSTICLDVSGRRKTIASRQHGEMADKNQKIALQPHLCSNSPLMTGPMLGGVLRAKETRPEYPPRSEGVNRSPMTPYVTAYDPEIPALCAIRRKKRSPNEVCSASPMFEAT